jgi:tRNA dimethylallyltransferase
MHKKLTEIDPLTAERLHPNDVRRVIRALEVYYQTGKSITEYQYTHKETRPKYKQVMFGLNMDRKLLYQRIEQRVDLMIANGLVEEVKQLLEKHGHFATALQGLGYKEIAAYLKGEYTLPEAIEILKRDTRRFAKRQITWFKADQRIKWLNVDNFPNKRAVAEDIAKQIAGELITV